MPVEYVASIWLFFRYVCRADFWEKLTLSFLFFAKVTVRNISIFYVILLLSQPAFTWSKLKIETIEQGVKYVQS